MKMTINNTHRCFVCDQMCYNCAFVTDEMFITDPSVHTGDLKELSFYLNTGNLIDRFLLKKTIV